MSEKIWSDEAWDDYIYWQLQDKKTLKRINQLIKDIERKGCMEGIGNPEPLKGDLQGEFSRRIDEKTDLFTTWKMGVSSLQPAADTTATNKDFPPSHTAEWDFLCLTTRRLCLFHSQYKHGRLVFALEPVEV